MRAGLDSHDQPLETLGSASTASIPTTMAVVSLKFTTYALMVGAALALVALRIVAPEQTLRIAAPLGVAVVALVAWWLQWRNHKAAARTVITFGVWSAMTAIALFTGGVRAPVVIGYPVVIVMVAWMIGTRLALLIAALTVASTMAMLVAEALGQLPTFLPSSPTMHAGDQVVVYLLSVVLATFLVRNYRHRLDELRKAGQDLRISAVDLERTRAALNQAQLIADEERFRTLIEWSPTAIAVHRDGIFVYVNPATASLLGAATAHHLIGQRLLDRIHPDFHAITQSRMSAILTKGVDAPLTEGKFLKMDGTVIDIDVQATPIAYEGAPAILFAMRDITERKTAQAQIETLAFYDPLTKLPNRRLLMERLEQSLVCCARDGLHGALLLLDLDNFKTLNDTLGHQVGDLLLIEVADRLESSVRQDDTVARLGGDEFVVLLDNLDRRGMAALQAESVAQKILKQLSCPYLLDTSAPDTQAGKHRHHCTASIGIAMFGGGSAISINELLKRADTAMYQSKDAGRNALRFFDAQIQAEAAAHAVLEADLREATFKAHFVLHYQTQVVGNGRVTGVEGLVRWQHAQRGLVLPAEFIAMAEANGLILSIGQWVLDTACEQLAAWALHPELAHLTLAVNVSARQFHQSDFVDEVLNTLERTAANPRLLKLELTESMLVDDVEDIINKMDALKAKGVGFSLDDFGTGYSSLTYLKRLPLDQLKIDQGFVRNIVTDPHDAAIAKMVVALANSMGLSVIAEGVELQAQADFLAHLGCHAYQGRLFSHPMPVQALEASLSGR
jgi:diguanylate cyclase (GGDEF)-like protein/PAS domain S-box-containing protein